MSQPKKQHIIPQCCLRHFVDPEVPLGQEPYVWIFERGTKRGKKKAPKNIRICLPDLTGGVRGAIFSPDYSHLWGRQ